MHGTIFTEKIRSESTSIHSLFETAEEPETETGKRQTSVKQKKNKSSNDFGKVGLATCPVCQSSSYVALHAPIRCGKCEFTFRTGFEGHRNFVSMRGC